MSNKSFNYVVSPFHLIILFNVAQALYFWSILAKEKLDPGLGGLLPPLLFIIAIIFFVTDLILQIALNRNKKIFYLLEGVMTVIYIIWFLKSNGIGTIREFLEI